MAQLPTYRLGDRVSCLCAYAYIRTNETVLKPYEEEDSTDAVQKGEKSSTEARVCLYQVGLRLAGVEDGKGRTGLFSFYIGFFFPHVMVFVLPHAMVSEHPRSMPLYDPL